MGVTHLEITYNRRELILVYMFVILDLKMLYISKFGNER